MDNNQPRTTTRHLTPRKAFLIAFDAASTVIAALLSLLLIFEGVVPARYWGQFKDTWFVFVLIGLVVFPLFGFYTQMWAFARGTQYLILFAGTTAHLFLSVLVFQLMERNYTLPTYILFWFLLTGAVTAIRLLYRFYQSHRLVRRSRRRSKGNERIRVMIVGAGAAGSQIIVELKTAQSRRIPVCAVDDNVLTHHYRNNGVPVLGDRHDIERLAHEMRIDEIIVAIPSASSETIRNILEICHRTDCRVRILPFFTELDGGKVHLSDVRDIRIDDLLGREAVEYDMDKVSAFIRDKTVLVTGGGGSIGSELATQIASFKPALLILYDVYENGVYELQQDLFERYGRHLNLKVLIGSVRDCKRIEQLFLEYAPDVVFHAAAHKHVPLMEDSPGEAVKNNIYGTYNVALTAARCGVPRFVLISTDKAVNPTNVMGASKRLCEIVIMALDKIWKDTSFAAVRFGNVLGSSGSVIPLFEKQIRHRHPVTVTHPKVERYFMTIPEASSLVLQAGAYAKGGEIFVLDMGDPVRIDKLARDMIRISGLVPDVDIPIQYIGLRPGEKMREELFLSAEQFVQTDHKKIFSLTQVDDMKYLKKEVAKLEKIIGADEELGLSCFMKQLLSVLESCGDVNVQESRASLPDVPYDPHVVAGQSLSENRPYESV
ncbi:MAG TPA: polysaccharide biosynthesis protein [Clostridiaceae bacterium]|jgi:FlaA1/EpsC-like NDP-sugar epimerase|nr:polysaccharide biosynthesis protein [Clostridiaceae bacterium]